MLGKTLWIMWKSTGYQQPFFRKKGFKPFFSVYNRVNNCRQKGLIIVLCCQGNLWKFTPDFGEKVGKTAFDRREKRLEGEKRKYFL